MKYRDLLNFEPITEVVRFDRTGEEEYQKTLVKTFVFSNALRQNLIPLMVRNIDFESTSDAFGLQIVGNYGTGKSHLMSLVSLIAEDASLLEYLNIDEAKAELSKIAGKFKVLRFELGNTESLWEVVTYKIEEYLNDQGVSFSFETSSPLSYYEKIQLMMAEFESQYPDKGFLVVIDEMLAYLKGRSTPDKLNQDLQVLQALGQACDRTKFKFMFGVQEMIYQSPEFQFAAEMLQKVNDRYKDIIITREDVAFIVKNRLLKKDEHQKQKISTHLDPFLKFFTDMHGRKQDYVELFPIHPSYFENFERIKIGRSQREILKTLSHQFDKMLDMEVPKNNPGLLTYDQYWNTMGANPDMMAIPDVRRVKEITDNATNNVETFFIGVRQRNKPVAERIINACAIKVLQESLKNQNGTNAEQLVDDLCLTNDLAEDRDFLIDIINSTAQNIISATSGQYFDQNNENGEYHLRIEGGVNFDQLIKDYASQMSNAQKDEYFFKFLEVSLPLDYDTYRTGFKIWEHSIEWKSHRTFRNGYIFFGNPGERSTTHPQQHFYMYFMPLFNLINKKRDDKEDEIYFDFDGLSNEFLSAIELYGAALALSATADTSRKGFYLQKSDEHLNKARNIFNKEYVQVTKVFYSGSELPLSGYTLPGAGASKEQIFSSVASYALEEWFENERPDYPKFSQLNTPLTKDNFQRMINQALRKVINPQHANRDGEGVLSGLGCWVPGMLDYSHSRYANKLLETLKEKGEGKVLNQNEILEPIPQSNNLWISKDFQIEAELQFVVISVLVGLGEIEITLNSGENINSTNLEKLLSLSQQDFYQFSHIKPPRGFNLAALRLLFSGLLGHDLSNHLSDPTTYSKLIHTAEEWAKRAVKTANSVRNGILISGIDVITASEGSKLNNHFTAFAGFCDKVATYTSEAKIRNFQYSVEDLNRMLPYAKDIEKVEQQLKQIQQLETDIQYLRQAQQYITDSAFKVKITDTLNHLSTILAANSDKKINDYRTQLQTLKEEYADWYLKQYLKYHISKRDNTIKQSVLDSEDKQICDILKDTDFLSTAEYTNWLQAINRLKPVDSNVNKELILSIPFHDFNPNDYYHTQPKQINELKGNLETIISQWIETMKDVLEDPAVQKNMSLIATSKQELLEGFKTDKQPLTIENATAIRNAIIELQKGLEKIEINVDNIKSAFQRPLTPDEAVDAFKQYIDKLSQGRERNKIRIVLK